MDSDNEIIDDPLWRKIEVIFMMYLCGILIIYIFNLFYTIQKNHLSLLKEKGSIHFWFGIFLQHWEFPALIPFILFSIIILICFSYMIIKDKKNIVSRFKNFKKIKVKKKLDGTLFNLFKCLSIYYVWAFFIELIGKKYLIYTVSKYSNIPSTSVYPPIFEEINFRVLLIGVPVVIMIYYYTKDLKLKNLLGGFGYENKGYITIILFISSLSFGIAHFQGRTDSLYYFIYTFIGGFFFGHLYIKEGLHTSILLHFFINSSSDLSESWVFWDNSNIWLMLPFGFIGLVYIASKIKQYLRENTNFYENQNT